MSRKLSSDQFERLFINENDIKKARGKHCEWGQQWTKRIAQHCNETTCETDNVKKPVTRFVRGEGGTKCPGSRTLLRADEDTDFLQAPDGSERVGVRVHSAMSLPMSIMMDFRWAFRSSEGARYYWTRISHHEYGRSHHISTRFLSSIAAF